jgi:hypothetical protein
MLSVTKVALKNRFNISETGAIGIGILWGLVAVFFFVILPFFVFGKVVPPDMIGLRQNYYSIPGLISKGYQEKGLEPGLQWKIPYISNVLLFPRTFQLVNLDTIPFGGDLDLPSLDVPTTDGSKVKTDVTLVFRIYSKPGKSEGVSSDEAFKVNPEEANDSLPAVPFLTKISYEHMGPRELVTSYTVDRKHQLNTLSRIAEDELRKALSSLSTTDYYNPILRERAALKAQYEFNKIASKVGIELQSTLIRRYVYAEREIDNQIFAKNLQDQTERLNHAASLLAEIQAQTEQQRALWDAKITDLQVEGESKVNVVRSEGDLFEQSKNSEGNLLVATARAEVDTLKARALTDSSGVEIYVAREFTPLLKTLRGGVVSEIDPYNVNAWVKRFISK